MLNKKHTVILNLLLAVSVFSAALPLSAQSEIPDFTQPLPEAEGEQLPEDEAGSQNQSVIKPELQKNFTIISSVHSCDLNPHTASYSLEAQILTGLYEGLFSYNPVTLEPEPAVAAAYRISRDKCRWTFILREDAAFSNGDPITAEDVRESWLDLIAEPAAPYSSLFDIVKGAKEYRTGTGSRESVGFTVDGSSTLKVQLTSPAAHLPKILCMSAFTVVNKDPSVSSGPFYIEEKNPDSLILKKNLNYHDRDNTKLEQITILQCDDGAENAHSFNTGKADWICGAADISKILSKNSIHLSAEFATEYLFFKINKEKDSIWNSTEFRAALLEAVPWDQLRTNRFVPAQTLVYPLSGYPPVQGYSYTDTAEAAALMKQARKNAAVAEDALLPIVFAVNGSDYMKQEADLLKQAWQPLGVDVQTVEIPPEKYLYSIAQTQADIFSYTWIGDFADPLAFLELFRGNSTLNVTNWHNKEYDGLLDEAASYTDDRRINLLAKAEQLLLDDAVLLPIQHPVSLNVIDLNAAGGWAANSFDIHPMKFLYRKETSPAIPNIVMRTR